MSLNQVFEKVAADSGRHYKLGVLTENNSDLLQRVVFLALDPFTQFYIRKIPAYQTGKVELSLDQALLELTRLSNRSVTGNAAIEHLSSVLSRLSTDDAKVVERIIQKDLRCGVSEATANAVWPNLIHEYPCMLASAYDQKLVDKVEFPAYVQLKLDGMRFNAIVRNGGVEFRSRNGKEINIADPLFQQPFVHLAQFYGCDMVFDGELLCMTPTGEVMDRKTGNGIINKAVKGTQTKEEGSCVRATLWDAIPYKNFCVGVDKEQYNTRLAKLSNSISDLKNRASQLGHLVDLVPTRNVSSLEEVRGIFEKYLAAGQEGVILKTRNMIWENKRSKHQIKFKGELECDLKVVGWEEGTGKNHGRMGALVLESADHSVRVNVGTGFTDADRDAITSSNSIGRIVAIKYNARITDKRTDTDSLFLPVFIEFRDDKTVADSSKDIK